MITNRLTLIIVFILFLSVAPNAAAYCQGDTDGAQSLFSLPTGGQVTISYTASINHTPNAHPTCFGSLNGFVFTDTSCESGWIGEPHAPDGVTPSSDSVTAMTLCNIPCGVEYDLGGNFDWNGVSNARSAQALDRRHPCDCSPWPPGPPQEGCLWSYYECDWVDCCPLVFDTSGRGYRLTSADRGVWFDINADGTQNAISWTDPSKDVAFLAFDRNGNGTVDDGEELFGNSTPLPSGSSEPRASDGFDALASLEDSAYGPSVADGVIDARDAAYHKLLMWKDASHDGISQPNELKRASEAGLVAIETRYRESKRRDEFGNEFRLRGISWWQRRNRLDARVFYDVWFVPRR